MKIATAAWLAGAAMMLTSLTVAALSGDRDGEEAVAAAAGKLALDRPELAIDIDLSSFSAPGTVALEGRLGHGVVHAAGGSDTYLYFALASGSDAAVTQPAAVNLAIVIDRSGSMQGKRLVNAVEAARGMVERLRDGDVVSVITYNTQAETLVAPTTVNGSSRVEVASRIAGIAAQGDTCISCAIDAGLEILQGRDGLANRILLLSDGEATAGVRDVEGFERLAERARDSGCSISSVGVDADYNERIMTTVASASNGRHYFVADPGGLAAIFDRELESLLTIVATDVELRVELAPGIELLEVYDRAYERRGSAIVASMGMVARGEHRTLLIKVKLPASERDKLPIADVRLSYRDLTRDEPSESGGQLVATTTTDRSRLSELNPEVGARVQRAQTTAALWEANRLYKAGDNKQAHAAVTQRRKQLAAERSALVARAAPAKRAAVQADVDRQMAVLGGATAGFGSPADAAPGEPASKARPKPASARKGRVQVRQNAFEAFDMAY